MRRLVQLIADFEPGELAFAELMQRLAVAVPDADVNPTVVDRGDTLVAGLCVAQLALADGPAGRLVVHDVGAGERLCFGRSRAGALVVGPDAGWSWSFVVNELRELFYLDVTARASRDLVPVAVRHAVVRHTHAASQAVPRERVPPVPTCAIASTDRAGNLKTTLSRLPAAPGDTLRVGIGQAQATALVADRRVTLPDGELVLAPSSLGWPTRDGGRLRLLELLVSGGSAAERFDYPPSGTSIAFAPVQPRAPA